MLLMTNSHYFTSFSLNFFDDFFLRTSYFSHYTCQKHIPRNFSDNSTAQYHLYQTDMFATYGRISPIYKKDAKDNIKNYCRISTLPIFGKIFEKITYSPIYDYVTSKNILSETQFGFCKLHVTRHDIHQSENFIKKFHSASKHVIGTFIDLSKAFDTIDHNAILSKLYNYGIRGTPHDLITSYFSNRKQYVKIGDEESEKLAVKYPRVVYSDHCCFCYI